MKRLWPIRRKMTSKRGERGYVILVILLMLALLTLAIVQAAPSAAVEAKRTQEEELVHRGDQYVRAIRRFHRKFGRYPNSLDELKDTNHMRFLRREYKDPITGKDFKLLHPFDVNYQPTGFFGKSLNQVGAGNIGNNISPNSIPPINQPNLNQPGASNPQTTAQGNQPQNSTDSNGLQPGQIFGGGPIVGVSSTSTKASIMEINGKNHYNDWQFFYDQRMDLPITQQLQMFNPGNTGGTSQTGGQGNTQGGGKPQ